MAILDIIKFPHPRLHNIAKTVTSIDDRVKQLVADMFETMYHVNGIGLAATQVDVHERIAVIDYSEERNQPLVLINPEITWRSEETVDSHEGCLSVPTIYDTIKRSTAVEFNALDLDGKPYNIRTEEFLAIVVQHELDHLAGKVFIQHLSPFKFSRIEQKIAKAKRNAAREK